MLLTAASIRDALPPQEPGEDPKRIATEAFRLVIAPTGPNFLLTNEQDQFKAAVGALLLRWSKDRPELAETVQAEMAALGALSAAGSGVPVDLASVMGRLEGLEPIGLLGLYREARGGP